MEEKNFKIVNEKLDKVCKLLAIIAIQGKTFREQIQLLSSIGMGPTDIAKLIGKDVNTIKVTKSIIKKGK